MQRRRRQTGFTIIEILISIAVITIAIFGTVAAIAFGLRASELGKTNTFSIGVNRKVSELLLGGNYPLPNPNFQAGELAVADMTSPFGTAPWRPLYRTGDNTWFKLADYGYINPASPDAQKFITEAPGYELHVWWGFLPAAPATHPDSRLRRIVVTTRWRDKSGWKNVQTEAFSN
jgi:type II secretory pathway pseudopilin PulG